MLFFFKKKSHTPSFDRKVLRKNDISILFLDERWHKIFESFEKPTTVLDLEEKIKELIKEESRLTAEVKKVAIIKKKCMDKILQLTSDAYENNDEEAKNEMQLCEKEIRRINERLPKIAEELDKIPDDIKEKNLELLEEVVNLVYFKIRNSKKRKEELEKLIEDTRTKLKGYIDEKESLAEDATDVYAYFHDLLGAEELEKLDQHYKDG